MTGCNRVFALFPYLFEIVPMFWCSGFDCLNIMPVPFSLQISNGRSFVLRRRYTIRFASTEPPDCPVHGSIVTCDMSLECPGYLKIG